MKAKRLWMAANLALRVLAEQLRPNGIFQKAEHNLLGHIFDEELIERFRHGVGRIAQEQLKGVSVGRNGIDREAFLHGQVVAEKPFHEVG